MKKNKKIIFNPYNVGGIMNTAGAGLKLVDLASGNASTKPAVAGLSGAATGAQAGMAFGPVGAAVGGVVGGMAGIIGSNKAQVKEDEMLHDKQTDSINDSLTAGGFYAAKGGSLPGSSINTDANFNSFNEGGTHEQNPLGGIPQGVGSNGKPNFVEQGETSYKFSNGTKFIFSDRIKIKK